MFIQINKSYCTLERNCSVEQIGVICVFMNEEEQSNGAPAAEDK